MVKRCCRALHRGNRANDVPWKSLHLESWREWG